MRKKLIFCIIFIMACSIHCFAESDVVRLELDPELVTSITISVGGGNGAPLIKDEHYKSSHFSHEITDRNEIEFIVFLMNRLDLADDGKQGGGADVLSGCGVVCISKEQLDHYFVRNTQ